MKYQIRVDYRSGDSFKSYDTHDILPHVWENLDVAKAALARIREHYVWYDGRTAFDVRYGRKEAPQEPEWHKGMDEHGIKLALDNGAEVQQWAQWCGYFEHLYGAKIVIAEESKDDGMEFEYSPRY